MIERSNSLEIYSVASCNVSYSSEIAPTGHPPAQEPQLMQASLITRAIVVTSFKIRIYHVQDTFSEERTDIQGCLSFDLVQSYNQLYRLDNAKFAQPALSEIQQISCCREHQASQDKRSVPLRELPPLQTALQLSQGSYAAGRCNEPLRQGTRCTPWLQAWSPE